MSVTRKGRVQVRTGISKQGAETYRAVDVVHVGPQRKQSQASNYERLARDLGQFNRALGEFSSGVSAYAKRAEKQAEKLKKEKEAAERRAKAMARRKSRGGGGGRRRKGKGKSSKTYDNTVSGKGLNEDKTEQTINTEENENFDKARGIDEETVDVTADPGNAKELLGIKNETKEAYKNFTHANRELAPAINAANHRQMAEWEEKQFKAMDVDEDGNEIGERTMTLDELDNHYLRREKTIIEEHGHNPLAVRALMNRNQQHQSKARARLLKYEEAERKQIASEFNRGNVAKFVEQGKADGLSGDELLETVQKRLVADGALLNPAYGSQDAAKDILGSLLEASENNPTMAEARTILEVVKSSPDAKTGVSALYKHPKHREAAAKLIQKLSKGIAKSEAEAKSLAVGKVFLKKALNGEGVPRLQTITGAANGETHTITVKDQLKAMSTELESRALAPNEDGIVLTDPKQIRDNLISSFGSVPALHSPKLKSMLGLRLRAGDQIDPNDPALQESLETASAILNSGPGGLALLQKHTTKAMVPYYQMVESLERSGLMDKGTFNEVFSNAVANKKDGFNLKVPSDLKPAFKDLEIDGLNTKQTAAVAMAVKMTLQEGDTLEDVQDRIVKVTESYKSLNPTRHGQVFKIPSDITVDPTQFKDEIDHTIDVKVKDLFPEFKDKKIVPRLHGDEYYLYDVDTKMPLLHPDTKKPMAMDVDQIAATITTRRDRAAKEAEEARKAKEAKAAEEARAKAGGDKAWNALFGLKAREQTNQSQAENKENSMWAGLKDLLAGSFVSAEDRRDLVGPAGEELLRTEYTKKEAESMMNDLRASRRDQKKRREEARKISGGAFAKNQRKIDREQFEALQAESRE